LFSNFLGRFVDSILADTQPPLSPTFYEFLAVKHEIDLVKDRLKRLKEMLR
jgi:hypothetical protein